MKFVFYTNSISPHQLPLARELIKRIGEGNYRYIYTSPMTSERKILGWNDALEKWIVCEKDAPKRCREWLENCDVLMSGIRDFSLFEKRIAAGRKTIYSAERWFKPIMVFGGAIGVSLPGWIRLVHPHYLRYAMRMARLISDKSMFYCYPMGVWAKRDIELICRIFLVARNKYEQRIKVWGYFVEPSLTPRSQHLRKDSRSLQILWVGRLLRWKRVEDIVRAVKVCCLTGNKVTFDIYGFGPNEQCLKGLIAKLNLCDVVRLYPPVPVSDVRRLMCDHDVFVLASNACEGWGATVSEALVEGMRVVGTYEAGASATMLPSSNLYHAGDWKALARILSDGVPLVSVGQWNVKVATDILLTEIGLT